MVKHNHMTRDVKPRGKCPKCDEYHDRGMPLRVADKPLDDWFRKIGTQLSDEDYEEGIRLLSEAEAECDRLRVSEHGAALDGHENASERDNALAECVMLREQLRLSSERVADRQARIDKALALATLWEAKAESLQQHMTEREDDGEDRVRRVIVQLTKGAANELNESLSDTAGPEGNER